jgi:hypothetical protein
MERVEMTFQKRCNWYCIFFAIASFILLNGEVFGERLQKGQLNAFTPSQGKIPEIITEHIIFDEHSDNVLQLWQFDNTWGIGKDWIKKNGSQIDAGVTISTGIGADLVEKYPNNANNWAITTFQEIPKTSERILLKLWHRFQFESTYDFGKVLVRVENSDWQPLRYFTGETDWYEELIDISYLAGKRVQLGFQLKSDESIAFDGWQISSISIVLASTDPLSAVMTSLNPQNFPFIYINVAVDTSGVGHPGLSSNNFTVRENGALQTNYLEVTPPESGGGSRLTDIVFIMDNSGSMAIEQAAVSNNVIDFVNDLSASGNDFALGLCRYGQSDQGGMPIIEENGQLTRDADYFKNSIWTRNTVDGSHEPGYYAITEAIANFSFRPGAQRILIIITDESPDQGNATQNDALDKCVANSLTLYALTTSDLYSTFEPITSATNGEYYNIYSDFSDILADIKSEVANTYIIRYSSSDPALNGVERFVDVYVNYIGNQEIVSGSYIPGAAPAITRTKNTLDLHDRAWSESTEFIIEADISDSGEPYVQGAKLYFKNTQNASYHYVNMVNISGDLWRGTISGYYASAPGIDYYITATDGENTVSDPSIDPSISPYQIAILPNEAPKISHAPVTSITPNTPIEISASIFDNTNYLTTVKLYYRMVGDLLFEAVNMQLLNNNYQAEIPANFVTIDGVEYYIKAWDDFNVSSSCGTSDDPHIIVDSSSEIEGALSADLAGPTELQLIDNQYTPNPFTMSVIVSYSSDATVIIEDFRLISTLGPGLRWPEGESSVRFMGSLAPGETRQASWLVKPTDNYAGDSWYGVEITSKTTLLLYIERELFIPENETFPPPEIIIPPDSSSNITINPTTFRWHSVEGAQWYFFKLSTAMANGAVFFYKSGLTDTTISVEGLELDKKYYWQLQASNIGIVGDLTLWNEFTTGTGEIDPPQLIDPVANKDGVGSSAWFNWEPKSDAASYDIQIDNDVDFSSPLVGAVNVSGTRFFARDMQYNQEYHWRVRSRNATRVSNWSGARKFKTMAAPYVHINYPNDYVVYYLAEGDQYFIDREYTVENIPQPYNDLLWLKTGADEKYNTDSDFLSITLDSPSTIFVGYDHRGTNPPDWLISQFTLNGDTISVSDIYGSPYNVWKGDFSAGTHVLGGNWAGRETGARITYCVFFETSPFYSISGAVKYFAEDKPVPNVTISPTPKGSQKLSGNNGAYLLNDLEAVFDYIITPTKPKNEDQDHLTITSQDAYETAQIAMGNATPSTYQTVIADVDDDGRILMWDASLIARYAAGMPLPDSIKIGEWGFDPAQRSYANLQQSYEKQDYCAYVIGDVDGSWTMPATNSLAKHELFDYFIDSTILRLFLPLRDKQSMTSIDLEMSYNPEEYGYSGFLSPDEDWQVVVNSQSGRVNIAAFSDRAQVTSLFSRLCVTFKLQQEAGQSPISIERFLINGQPQTPLIANIDASVRNQIPKEFKLFQNYPNPFNPTTQIHYTLPWQQPEQTSVKIYDIRGSLVRVLFTGMQVGGEYTFEWDGQDMNGVDVPSGLYFCSIQANNLSEKIKMIKAK